MSHKESLEDIVVDILQRGPVSTAHLIELVSKKRKITKQGVYFCLRGLAQQEVIVVHNKQVSLNVRFIKKMKTFFETASHHYLDSSIGTFNVMGLQEGEQITYSFRNPITTDVFWWDALYALSLLSPNTEPVYLYNPHEWFLLARRESELEAIAEITKKRRFLLTVPGTTVLDKYVSRDFDGNKSQYHMVGEPLFSQKNYYFNVLGDFIIEVWIDKKIAEAVEHFYANIQEVTKNTIPDLISILEKRGRSKLCISRNKKKAEKLRRLVKKYFYIPV